MNKKIQKNSRQTLAQFNHKHYLCNRKAKELCYKIDIGALVQLVRIHACHAWGHGFESRTHRKRKGFVMNPFFCVTFSESFL